MQLLELAEPSLQFVDMDNIGLRNFNADQGGANLLRGYRNHRPRLSKAGVLRINAGD